MHPYTEFVNPFLGKLLKNIKMDKSFIRGEGCWLYDNDGNRYLDCIASYGALPFGYNLKEIWECITDYQNSQVPSFIQPSYLNAAGELARRLAEIAPRGLKYVTFTNSGTETVEAAIKLCRSSTGRLGILSTNNSFHGKTLGALSATGKASYQSAFGAPVNGFSNIKYGDIEALEAELSNNKDYYAAFIVEPLQGEGGIVEPPEGYLKHARELCKKYGVFLIIDEIQTGLGRTGKLFACEYEDVCPDVLLLAKALGGGIMPIGACICTDEVYNEEFAMKHSSTFAANSLACRIGIKSIDMLTDEGNRIIENARLTGSLLKEKLLALKAKYPAIIKNIRGKGLMLGIEFGIDTDTMRGTLLGIMAEQDLLAPIISSYLLNKEKVRVAPTLNGGNVIRVEPPLIINKEQCFMALQGIENMLKVLSQGNTAAFLSFLIDADIKNKNINIVKEEHEPNHPSTDDREGRFAFLVHPTELKNYVDFDQSLSLFSEAELSKLADTWNDMVNPFVIGRTRIESKCGRTAYGEFIAIPRTAEQMITLPKESILKELKKALAIARQKGARIAGLGAYTSVVSGGGLYLKDEGIPLTTGNSYTVVSAVEAVTCALDKLGIPPEYCSAAVVGAAGSIGRGISLLISENVSKLILIGNPNSRKAGNERLYIVAAEIYRYLGSLVNANKKFKQGSIADKILSIKGMPSFGAPIEEFIQFAKYISDKESPIKISSNIDSVLPFADVVISATSSTGKIITVNNLKSRAVVCDISRPSNVDDAVRVLRTDVLVIDGGIIEVPGRPNLGWDFGFDKGLAYACMSETMMLALEHHYIHTSLGASGISLDNILLTKALAQKHGFKLASFKSFNKPLDDKRWLEVIGSREHTGTGAK